MIDIAIIGGGPAGLSAGLYAARGGVKATLFEELFLGGQAAKTNQIDNYPGFEEGVLGSELGAKMEQQALRFGLSIHYGAVEKLELHGPVKRVYVGKDCIEARTIILSMGASPRRLGVPGESEFEGKGVSYCATCDGAFFRGKRVAVAGGGDTALSDALYLARMAKEVAVIHRRDAFRGGIVLQKAVLAEENVRVYWNTVVTEVMGEKRLTGLRLENTVSKEETTLAMDGFFVAVGVMPNSGLALHQVETDGSGYILTDQAMQTNLPGVYGAGDVRKTPLRQVVTAVSDGAVAATHALEFISAQPISV